MGSESIDNEVHSSADASRSYPPPPGYNPTGIQPLSPVDGEPYGQPVLGQPQVVGYVDAKEHYNAACVGTAFCGCWGCFATSCFCNTIPGKLGAATGCIIQSAVWTVVYATLLCIVLATVVDCNTDMTSANTSRAACEDIGTYEDDVCTFRRCPPDYTLVHGETPQAAYCKNEDHNSCFLNMDALSLGVRLAIYVICIVVSVYMRRVYQKQMRTIGNPTAVVQHSYHPLQTELIPERQAVTDPVTGKACAPWSSFLEGVIGCSTEYGLGVKFRDFWACPPQ
eukprot:gene11563-17808_t